MAPDPAATAVVTPAVMRVALEERGVMREDMPEEEQARLVLAVMNACGGLGPMTEEEEEDWELNEDDVAEVGQRDELRSA
jgi:hypothetical protein